MSLQEEFARKELSDLMLRAMRNKDEAIRELLSILTRQQKVHAGLHSFTKALSDGKDRNDQLAQMLQKTIEVTIEQAEALRQLAVISLIYLSGDTFAGDAAGVANKLGAGKEAIRELFRSKFGKNFEDLGSKP